MEYSCGEDITALKKFEEAYIKCIKMFFGYDRRHSAAMMLMDLRLPTLSTILHNVSFKFRERLFDHANSVAQYVHYVYSA